jgi:hypothetical protein
VFGEEIRLTCNIACKPFADTDLLRMDCDWARRSVSGFSVSGGLFYLQFVLKQLLHARGAQVCGVSPNTRVLYRYKFKGTSLWNQTEYGSVGCGHCKTRRQNRQRTASGPAAAAALTPENEML